MATINEKILACLSDRKTPDQALPAIDIARSVGIPVAQVSIYISGLKKKQGIEIASTEGRPTKYYLPNGPANPEKVPMPAKRTLPNSLRDPVLRALRTLAKQAQAQGKPLEALIAEKSKAIEAENAEIKKKVVAAAKEKIEGLLAKLDPADRTALLTELKPKKGKAKDDSPDAQRYAG